MFYPDIMVDLETTDTDPTRGAILQIAAVRFNLDERTVDVEGMFDRCLRMPPWRRWSEPTREWWSRQDPAILGAILQRGEDPGTVVEAFIRWAEATPAGKALRFWGKPTHFDFSFLSSYFHDFAWSNPFHYREATDMNSFLRGMYYPQGVPKLDIPFVGDAHNALFDVLNQIQTLFTHSDHAHAPAGNVVLECELLPPG